MFKRGNLVINRPSSMRDQLLVHDVNAHEPKYIYLGLKLPQLSKVPANVP